MIYLDVNVLIKYLLTVLALPLISKTCFLHILLNLLLVLIIVLTLLVNLFPFITLWFHPWILFFFHLFLFLKPQFVHLILFYHRKEHYLFFIFKLIFIWSFVLNILRLLNSLENRSWFKKGLSWRWLLFFINMLFLLLFHL